MTNDKAARLAAIANRRTRYEVAAIAADNSASVVLGFSGRKTKRAMLEYAKEHGPELIAMFGAPNPDHCWIYSAGVLHLDTFVMVFRRTERDAIIEGPVATDVSL